jgi:hypothetical protein
VHFVASSFRGELDFYSPFGDFGIPFIGSGLGAADAAVEAPNWLADLSALYELIRLPLGG